MSRDCYAEARDLARHLDAEGYPKEARSLVDAIESGSTGTEILMALTWNLRRIDQADLEMNHTVKAKIQDLAATISEIVRG